MESLKYLLLLGSVATTLIVSVNSAVAPTDSKHNVEMTFALDFDNESGNETSSNHPKLFLQALKPSFDVLGKYANTENIPAYGFGAYVPRGSDNLSQLFNLNMKEDPVCKGPQEVIKAYTTIIEKELVGFSETGNIAPVIERAAEEAKAAHEKDDKHYRILLILTDGFDDLAAAKEAVIKASKAPLSIIILGIGDGESHKWKDAIELDSDDEELTHNDEKWDRDVVHFAEAQKIDWSNPEEIEENLLEEYPEQVADWEALQKQSKE